MPLSGFMAPVTLVGSARAARGGDALRRRDQPARVRPGPPILWGGSPAIFDVRFETTPMGAVETMMLDCANSEIGKRLGLPTQGYIALSDAKQLDAQAGLETGIGATLAALVGHQQRLRPRHAGLRELPEPGEAGARQRDLRDGGTPAPRHRAARRLPVAPALRGAAAREAPADRRPHPQAPEGADPVHLPRRRAGAARAVAGGGRDDARPTGEPRGGAARRPVGAVAPSRRDEARAAGENGRGGARGGDGRVADGRGVREIVRFSKQEAVPEAREVLAAQGLPEGDALAPRLHRLLDEAMSAAVALVEPRAVCEEVSAERFGSVLAPLGIPGDDLVVGRVYPRAGGLALFVATLGEALPARIRQLFDEDALAEAWMLDAVASAGADLLADRRNRVCKQATSE